MAPMLEAAPAAADPMRPAVWVVRARRRETADTVSLTVAPAEGGVPAVAPGQFNMLWAFGVGEAALSIGGATAAGVLHTVRAVGATSERLTRLRRGEALGVRGPFGSAWPLGLAEGRDVVVMAGGLGLAPLRGAVRALLRRRRRVGRLVVLVGARTPEDVPYGKELARWAARGDLQVQVTVDRAGRAWTGPVGLVTALLDRVAFEARGALALVCGPEVMMRASARALVDRGVGPERVFLSMERNMKCGVASCGHCQLAGSFVCREGPVYRYDRVRPLLDVREL